MNREEQLQKLAEMSNEWRQMDIEIGAKRERERIIALIESSAVGGYADADYIVFLLKGEN